MPKRKIKYSLLPPGTEAAALAAIKDALGHPKVLTPDEERGFLERRAHAAVERHEYIVTERRGKRVYREHGKAGADLPVPPYAMEMLKRQRDFEAECAKVDRELKFKYSTLKHNVRHHESSERASRIRESAKTMMGRGSIKAIARKENCSVDTVRRALKRGI